MLIVTLLAVIYMVEPVALVIISDVDELPPRVCIDAVKNPHGATFVDFSLESRMCITNGRVTAEFEQRGPIIRD